MCIDRCSSLEFVLLSLVCFLLSAYYHIAKVIEASRVHLFDIVTQYRAIFSDDDQVFLVHGDSNINHSDILHAWIGRKVTVSDAQYTNKTY